MKHRTLFFLFIIFSGAFSAAAQEVAPPAATPETSAVLLATPESSMPIAPTAPIAPLAPVSDKIASPSPGFPFAADDRGITLNFGADDEKPTGNKGSATTTVTGFDWQHVVVPIVGIVFSFGTPIILVLLILGYRMKKKRLLFDTIQKLVASGQPIPPELIASSGAKPIPTANSDRRRGIILCTIGLGLIGFFLAEDGSWGIGFIPLAIGIGYLLTAQFAPRDGEKN